MVSEIKLLSQLGYIFFPEIDWRIVKFMGIWEQHQARQELIPISGLCYWLTPPTWSKLSRDPFQVFIYVSYVLLTSTIFSHISVINEDHSDNPETVIYELLGPTELTMSGKHKDSDEALKQEIRRLVPVATVLGGLIWGLIWILCDILEISGGGQGMLLIAETGYRIYEIWLKEHKTTYNSMR
jgi:protein transport protein SEC61 subunit alpha